jgi:DNA-binding NtrC family response regulator
VRELQNVVEQAAWTAESGEVDLEHLPEAVRLAPIDTLMPRRERRRRLADDLCRTLVDGHYTFWDHVHPLLLKRDITRHDVRQLVSLGLAATRGNYRALLTLFGMPATDYKRFMNFLAAHDCVVDFREFRTPCTAVGAAPRPIPLPLEPPRPTTPGTSSRKRALVG